MTNRWELRDSLKDMSALMTLVTQRKCLLEGTKKQHYFEVKNYDIKQFENQTIRDN